MSLGDMAKTREVLVDLGDDSGGEDGKDNHRTLGVGLVGATNLDIGDQPGVYVSRVDDDCTAALHIGDQRDPVKSHSAGTQQHFATTTTTAALRRGRLYLFDDASSGLRPNITDTAKVDKWFASLHTDAKRVLKLWRAHADKRVQCSIENKAFTGDTPAHSIFRAAPRSAINPLFQSTLVLPTADSRSHFHASALSSEPATLDERLALYDPEIPPNWMHWAARFPVHEAAMLGRSTQLHFLLQGDHSAKAKDTEGWTPLHYASWYGQEDIVRILMEDWRGAPAEITPSNATALHLAARNGFAEIVRLLVACPIVDIQQKDANGNTPLDLCNKAQLNDWQDHVERRVLSQVALKLLFDEALFAVLHSLWPTQLADAVHLAGLLMQIRFGDFNPQTHVPGFLRGGLETFVPQHLLHNQLRTVEWERRIFAEHQKHKGVTDVLSLHRLFLQYCRQWPYYGATLFDGLLLKASRRKRPDAISLAINSDFVSVIMRDPMMLKVHLSWDEFKFEADVDNKEVSFFLQTSSTAKLEELQQYIAVRSDEQRIIFIIDQTEAMMDLMAKLLDLSQRADKDLEMKRMAQGGPRVHKLVSNQPAPIEPLSRGERVEIEQRQSKERKARYKVVHSFGTAFPRRGGDSKSAAEHVFDKFCAEDGLASINDLKVICYELGYWLGPELDGARVILDSSGTNLFSFRDLVSWWCQSSRSWLYLLDDQAFKKRHDAVGIFLRNDPNRTGKVSDEKLSGLINGLRSTGLTRKTEEAIRKGLDPGSTGFLAFNTYIDWLTNLHIIDDRVIS
ncbi:hypothetical protein PTSG_04471 [Salpingoeca rosetta]|uniref:Uncharacterized protein n=1 Tax=Salpingoeca rosetta (strain ATCC 50818 / BSB-021) TaxID=946362 RepID=F2U8N4_SALR5|nr:uncharacterized protein PTSG_04471 [Salpingoeca rosetta]EGD72742.1 hypothetical protein PTSG_04471 [Salpingoeca rosetta]|eukprot:XP_004994565.1 hypothetical protein PTSG_04471 [Salpingoeca rosetta]